MEAVFMFTGLLALTILLGHLVHLARIKWLTEGSVALLVGLFAGGAAFLYFEKVKGDRHIPKGLVSFDTEAFLDMLLPVIIFNAGFSVKKKLFFQNFMTLVLFGVVGTFLTAGAIAVGSYYTLDAVDVGETNLLAASLALGAIFASSDSIATLQILDQDATPLLYSLVFGEGVVNDATSIVLLRAIQKISHALQLNVDTLGELLWNFSQLFVLSLLLGVAMGLLSAWIIKHCFFRHSTDREVCLVALIGFLAHLLAESLQLSGIFAVFFAGITMSHYTWHGLSPSAKVVSVYLFRTISFLTELFLFIYAGFGMWSTSLWRQSIYTKRVVLGKAGVLAASLLVQVFLFRGSALLLLVALANTWRPRAQRIGLRAATVIWWAGSARGAVTVALAYHRFANEAEKKGEEVEMEDQIMVVASMAVVVFTTVVLGAVTGPFLDWLIGDGEEVEGGDTLGGDTLARLTSHGSVCDGPGDSLSGATQPLLGRYWQRLGHWNRRSYIHYYWHKLDCGFLQPLFGGRKAQPEGYHSPPPSPGRQNMYDVIGPHVLRRYTPVPRDSEDQDAIQEGPVASKDPGQGPELRLRPGIPNPEDSLPGLFTRDSSRLDDVREEEMQWQDRDRYGEGAYLAAGAPDEPPPPAGDRPSLGREGGGGGGKKLGRRLSGRSMKHQPLWPSPFDHPDPQEDEEVEDRGNGGSSAGQP